ncbi:Alvin_2107 family globule sulfur oxidation protein [Alkalilimnicola ehrlichii MLHE-1]|uniref:Uncharacterized protein n=1 Tax=Alkalilimnicola ehrlichii (strain ATCC BAA-1101 / DSM 17681 / MLHE-1) TaxID=187272 RepID=Q0A820_ALKEH|nr:hypothetical protein [Alkalilimnicola ehrlichii]ABI57017.1 hypothetical protein Mlg_1671 [Alkalilimnicola ehrlichii MLHE-1]
MDQTYYKTITQLEERGVDPEYLQGWVGGYLHNPPREEQRVTAAYEAGYQDGRAGSTDSAQQWQRH